MVECELKNLVSYCLQLMNKDIKDRNVKVLDTTGESVVMADQSQIQQIVLNLLLNALSAVPPKDTGS